MEALDDEGRVEAELRRRAQPRPLNEATNGHPPELDDRAASVAAPETTSGRSSRDPELESSEDDAEEKTWTPERRRLKQRRRATSRQERARLRYSTPEQLVAWHQDRHVRHLAFYMLAFRLINALITSQTVYAPDEHWQSLEIAHGIVFDGLGWRTWEWRDRRPPSASLLSKHWGDGPIRSVIYPILFVPAYWLLKVTGLHNTALLTILPSLFQAFFATMADVCFFKLTASILDVPSAWTGLLCSLCSAYTFHTTTRTLSNSLEAALTSLALLYWPLSIPKDDDSDFVGSLPLVVEKDLRKALSLFGVCAALRPSNVLFTIPLVIVLLVELARHVRSAGTALESGFGILIVGRTLALVGFVALVLLTLIDSIYFGRITITPLAFLKRNVLEGISLFYGASPLHFYLTSALPSIALTMLPFALWGWTHALLRPQLAGFDKMRRRWYGLRGERDPAALLTLAQASLLYVVSMSVLGHKEVRFLQPILPILHIFTAYACTMLPRMSISSMRLLFRRLVRRRSQDVAQADMDEATRRAAQVRAQQASFLQSLDAFTSWQGRQHMLSPEPSTNTHATALKAAYGALAARHGRLAKIALLAQLPFLVYLCFHSQGQVQIAEVVGQLNRQGLLDSVGYLMPCHSTPWQSHMHAPMLAGNKSWFITCEPPLDGQDLKTYQDESDVFYADPYAFLTRHFADKSRHGSVRPWPSHLVMFEALLTERERMGGSDLRSVKNLLDERGYRVHISRWNSFFHPDARRRGRVLLLARKQ